MVVPVPTLEKVSIPVPDPVNTSTVFQQQKICTKSYLFSVRSSIVSQKFGLLFLIFDFYIPFYVGSGCRPGSGTSSVKAKNCGFCGSGSTTLWTCIFLCFFPIVRILFEYISTQFSPLPPSLYTVRRGRFDYRILCYFLLHNNIQHHISSFFKINWNMRVLI